MNNYTIKNFFYIKSKMFKNIYLS